MLRRQLKASALVFIAWMLCNVSCIHAQIKVHVAPAPLVIDNTPVDMSLNAGQGFVIAASYQGGVPPFSCALIPTPVATGTPAAVPTWVTVDPVSIQGNGSDSAGSCTVSADFTPYPLTDALFTIQVTDAQGSKSTENVVVTNAPEVVVLPTPTPTPTPTNAVFTDDFNRATLGTNWTLIPSNAASIYNSTELQFNSGGSPQLVAYTGAPVTSDQFLQGTVTNLVGYFIGAAAHAVNLDKGATGVSFAACVCEMNNLCEYKEVVNGAQTVSLAYSVPNFATGSDIAIEAVGNVTRCYAGQEPNPLVQFGPDHTTTLTGGVPAVFGSYLTSTTNNGRMDNVKTGSGLLPK